MDEPAVEISGLSKVYKLRHAPGTVPVPALLRDRMSTRVREAAKEGGAIELDDDFDEEDDEELDEPDERRGRPGREIVALQGVSATVEQGQALAVVGPASAGKTVLMRVLTRVSPPTKGRVVLRGRPAPLLELATAFLQMTLSGEQNARLLGELFEVPREVIDRRIDEVLGFAGVLDERDVMLKHYSGGMQRRLALSAALNFEPDILLADETLVFGDAAFREKITGRVEELLRGGASMVFATDDHVLARRFCDQVLWLDRGRVVRQGPIEEVLGAYERALPELAQAADGSGAAAALGMVQLQTVDGQPARELGADEAGIIEATVALARPVDELRCALEISQDGVPRRRIVQPSGSGVPAAGTYRARVELAGGALGAGHYEVRAIAYTTVAGAQTSVNRAGALSFEILEAPMDDENDDEEELRSPFVKDTATPWAIVAESGEG